MFESAYRTATFALYQVAVVLGILLMPLALIARQLGVHLPIGHLVDVLGDAYDDAAEGRDATP